MLWTNVKRVFRSGFTSFLRNGFISATAILMMMVPLFILGSFLFSNFLLESELDAIEERVDVNVYFVTTASDGSIADLTRQVQALPEVASTSYKTRDEVLANFRSTHEDDNLTLQALDELGDNPFGATLSIRAKEVSQYDGIANFLNDHLMDASGQPLIDNVNYFQNKLAIGRLGDIIVRSREEKTVQVAFLAAIALLVIFNTIRLTIFHSRDEIAVMRLVGAQNNYIQGPFIVQGMLYGFIAAVLVLVAFFPVTYWFGSYFSAFPSLTGHFSDTRVFTYYLGHFPLVALAVIGGGLVLSGTSALLAVRKYLSV